VSLIISLSSTPARFAKIGPTLETLAAQCADMVCLYVPQDYRRFPDWDGTLPDVPGGVKIRRCAKDLGPATKILPAAKEFAGQDVDLLYADDDQIYADGWARSFLTLQDQHPGAVICQSGWDVDGASIRDLQPRAVRRWRITDIEFQLRYLWQDFVKGRSQIAPARRVFKRSGYVDVAEGRCGVLVSPDMFDTSFYDIPKALWAVDDVWLSGKLAAKGIALWCEAGFYDPRESEAEAYAPLVKSVIDGADRDAANSNGVEHFQKTHGIWL